MFSSDLNKISKNPYLDKTFYDIHVQYEID